MFACEVGHTAEEFFTDMPASMMRRDDAARRKTITKPRALDFAEVHPRESAEAE